MRIGFLVWNQFQVAHSVEIARHFNEPDFIFIDRSPEALKGFDPAWLVRYGAYCRFLSELDLQSLDGQYDAIVTQFRPPLTRPWKRTKLIMQQYSLAKPKTAYNARWFAADRGLVYGAFSDSIIGQMCQVSQAGNPRFDSYFERRLDPDLIAMVYSRLDPQKKTLVYLPTWGDLSTSDAFLAALDGFSDEFNVILRPHHLSSIRDREGGERPSGLIYADSFPPMLDLGLYLQEVADVVVSDMSGAIFDAIYCHKPVILVGDGDVSFTTHKKADDSAIEISQRHRIGPYVTDPGNLHRVAEDLVERHPYREANEELVRECFVRRGGCGALAAAAIHEAVEVQTRRPMLQTYAAPDFSNLLLSRAAAAAKRRRINVGKKSSKKKRIQAEIPGSGKRKAAAKGGKPVSMKALVKKRRFFEAGSMLEEWSRKPPKLQAQSLYQAQSAVSAIRFSRSAWRGSLARLFHSIYAPSTTAGRDLLQKLGMIRSAEAWYLKAGDTVPPELAERLQALGPLAGAIDLAARNEVAGTDMQMCITPAGGVVELASLENGRAIELYLLSSLLRDLKDEEQRPYRSSQRQFSHHLVEQLLVSGFCVYPRLQAGVDGATPVSAAHPAFTWHTLGAGQPGQFHLKIGTLFGHFIVDSKGYSGWSSIAGKELNELVHGVDQVQADAHWARLHEDLVAGGKSKYAQLEEALPEEWGEYIFLPMQVADDTVARLADIDTLSLLRALVDWASATGAIVVVKRHPMCRNVEIARTINEAELAGHIRVSNANIHQLVAGAACVVTVNSGVGAEALLQLKPVVTTGRSDYAAATRRVSTPEELYEVLGNRAWSSASEDEIRKFLWFYTKRYMVRYDDVPAIGERLRELLADADQATPATATWVDGAAAMDVAGVTSIPFVPALDMSGAVLPVGATDDLSLGEQCDQLLWAFKEQGVHCWVDSGSLLGLVRYGRLNDWEKDIDLGIWIDDFEKARNICRMVAERYSLWYREKWLKGVPYALLLSSYPDGKRTTLPLSVHMFFRNGEAAWSPQPYSLVAARSKYPRYVYREVNGPGRASFGRKVAFLARYPSYSLCIAAEKLNLTPRIGRSLKKIEQAGTLKEKLLTRLFLKVFQWQVPADHFDSLYPISETHPHVLVPGNVYDYLTARYGEWRIPVQSWFYLVDDGCITPASDRELAERLTAASLQVPAAALIPQVEEKSGLVVQSEGDTVTVDGLEAPSVAIGAEMQSDDRCTGTGAAAP